MADESISGAMSGDDEMVLHLDWTESNGAGISLAPFVGRLLRTSERQQKQNTKEAKRPSKKKRKQPPKRKKGVTLQHGLSTAMQVQPSRAVVSNLHEQLLQGI